MPSSQSDGVQSTVINKFKDMIFLPIETSGEGEVNAHTEARLVGVTEMTIEYFSCVPNARPIQ